MLTIFVFCFTVQVSAVELKSTPVISNISTAVRSPMFNQDSWGQTDTQSDSKKKVQSAGRKSPVKAAALSMVLPGLGHFYIGNKGKGKAFLSAESAVWAGYAAFSIYAGWREDDFINLARDKANASLEDKDDEFQDLVGFYDDIDQYNSFGRVFDLNRPYLEDNESNHWQWQSDADKATYRYIKNRHREAEKRASLMLGLAVVNRVVAAVIAYRDARSLSQRINVEFSNNIRIRPEIEITPFDSERVAYVGLRASF